MTLAKITASNVSRQLRAGGVTTSGSALRFRQEGVFVSGTGRDVTTRVLIAVDINAPGARQRLADKVEAIVRGHGYTVEVSDHDRGQFNGTVHIYVKRELDAPTAG